jgi:hypothetical protein
LKALGVAKDRITLESAVARHLRERASSPPAGQAGGRRALAARHVGLAYAARHRLLPQGGFPVEPWPVDFRTGLQFQPLRFHSALDRGLAAL